jgi:chemotaxis protein methyltransferase WspC
MTRIEQLLRRTIGLDAASVGAAGILRALRLRIRSLGLKKPEDYEQLLQRSRTEWNELVESVVVTETWFFRDAEPIAAFVRLVLEEWLPAHPASPLRLLSIPCASGEEPYSLAMALLDAGVPPDRFQVEAVDISARALARAHRGVYRKNSFRGKDLAFRDRYFQASKEGFVLAPDMRRCVHFAQANLFSDTFLPGHAIYDFIFCRNLLIYFDRPTQRKALTKLQRLLAPSGVLFVGPVEQPVVLDHGFVSANLPTAFASRKAGHVSHHQRLSRLSPRPVMPPGPLPKIRSQPELPPRARRLLSPTDKSYFPPQADLEAARRLADAGRLEEAAEICEARLRESQASAQAYYLLGLVRDATNDARAMDCYRKALYLEPNHYESLLQMALLLQKNGDATRAHAFRSRAQRVKMRMQPTP